MWCDSSYELLFIIYCKDNDLAIKRNNLGFTYTFNGEQHRYFPDFRVNGKLVEIKNYPSPLTDAKLSAVTEPIDVIYKEDMQPYFNHFKRNYQGKPTDMYCKDPVQCAEWKRINARME
jgi:hypothetical protein